MPIQSTTRYQSRLKHALCELLLHGKTVKLAKLILPALAIMTMAFGAVGAQAADQKVRIGVAMALFDDVWLTYVRDAMTNWAKQHPDVELTIVDAANDSAKQQGQVENFLAQGMDAIVILPVDIIPQRLDR